MPLNVRRFCTSSFLILFAAGSLLAQTTEPAPPVQTVTLAKSPTSGDIMRERISKAKAYIAVRNYNAAIYELENIRRETSDASVHGVVNVLLMNSYLEQGDYKRAQDFLTESFNRQKTNSANTSQFYNAVAGQVVKGARSRAERYRALGLNIADRNLPLEAVNDLERMREILELVITQSKEISKAAKEKERSADAMAMLEEATNSRSILARDDYDARRWKDEIVDAREQMANSRSVIINAVNDTPASNQTVAANNPPQNPPPVKTETTTDFKPVPPAEKKSSENLASPEKPIVVSSAPTSAKVETEIKQENPAGSAAAPAAKENAPLQVGSLISYATKQTQPVYPAAAKTMRTTGVVKVEVMIDENGQVSEVQNASGPSMLQTAAKDAIKKWRFRPFMRDGQPVKAQGYVSFNFNL